MSLMARAMYNVVTAQQMRGMEADAVQRGATWQGLMESAGAEVARHAIMWLGSDTTQRVLVVAGPGNNGGDALVVARHLCDHGWQIEVLTWSRSHEDTHLRKPLTLRGIKVTPIAGAPGRNALASSLGYSTAIIDGLLGTGIKRDVSGDLATTLGILEASRLPVIAIDIPTGVDSDTGAIRGRALRADLTVALGRLKYGHLFHPGKSLAGQIILGDIGLSASKQESDSGELMSEERVRELLPPRPDDSNKGSFGKVLVIAGSVNYIGAAALATLGAMRAGVGLATLATPGDLLPMLGAKLTECTFLPLPSDMGVIGSHAAEKVRTEMQGYDALLVGCGIGKEKETATFLRSLLAQADLPSRASARSIGFASRMSETTEQAAANEQKLPPLVLDGDALNIISSWEEWDKALPAGSVLTPHPSEMARLTGATVDEVQADRVGVARDAAARWKCIVVLKGASTVVAGPDGRLSISPFSNPALATAGTGDVLAGAIAGIIAQGASPVEAAIAGVYLHGLAGEFLAEKYGPAGGLAGDLPELLALAQKRVRNSGTN